MIRKAALIALLIAGITQLRADGINNPASGGSGGGQIGFIEGVNNLGVGGSGGGGCSNKLDFTQSCNSQYIGIF